MASFVGVVTLISKIPWNSLDDAPSVQGWALSFTCCGRAWETKLNGLSEGV